MGYKGDWYRKRSAHVTMEERDLKYDLCSDSTTPERKVEIKKRLAEIEEEKKQK